MEFWFRVKRERPAMDGEAAYQRRGAADCGEYREAAELLSRR
jgi:hypothetical protein